MGKLNKGKSFFNWHGKMKTTTKVEKQNDVKIDFLKNDIISIKFYNESALKFKSQYVAVAVYKNKVLFNPDEKGFRCAPRAGGKETDNHYIYVQNDKDFVFELKEFCGEYMLQYDKSFDLYYIEKR